jgi:hypothetical protein
VAHCKLCPFQGSKNEKIQNQTDAHFLFGSEGIVHKEFVQPRQTVNQTFCREALEGLEKRVARVRPGIARTSMLHRNNTPCGREKHSCGSSPDLSLCDFFLFLRLKNHLKGRHFDTLDNIQNSVTDEMRDIPALLRTLETTPPSLFSCPRELFEGDKLIL